MMRGVAIVGGCSSYVLGFVAAKARHSIISYSNGLLTINFEEFWIAPRLRIAYCS